MIHELKILPVSFFPISLNSKSIELKKGSRNYSINDYLHLKEFDQENNRYTENEIIARIVFVRPGVINYGSKGNFIVLTISVIITYTVDQVINMN